MGPTLSAGAKDYLLARWLARTEHKINRLSAVLKPSPVVISPAQYRQFAKENPAPS